MRKLTTLALIGASALAVSAGTASAQTWTDERYDAMSDRIDAASRMGDITTGEAAALREELGDVGTLASRYEDDGDLTSAEMNELNVRYDRLSARLDAVAEADPVRLGWYGGAGWTDRSGVWTPVDARQVELQRRIDRGVDTGRLTRAEAIRLQSDYRAIARTEARYRRNGLSAWERADLDRRFDRLADRIRWESRDAQYGYGYGYGR